MRYFYLLALLAAFVLAFLLYWLARLLAYMKISQKVGGDDE